MTMSRSRFHLLPLLLTATFTSACLLDLDSPGPGRDPCEPNPCTQGDQTRCVNEAGQARCLCKEGTVQRPSGACEPVGAANCPEHTGDTSEPDDCQSRAVAVSADGKTTHLRTIEPFGDYDFFRFEAIGRRLYSVTVRPEGGVLAPRVDGFDQGGAWLGSAEHPTKAELIIRAHANAPHFVRVSHSPLDVSAATGPYALVVADIGQDDIGDSPSESASVSPEHASTTSPTDYSGRLEYGRDVDWFAFSVAAGSTYRIYFDTTRYVPAFALYAKEDLDTPLHLFRGYVTEVKAQASTTFYMAVYSPEGDAGSYALNVLYY
jgi:hypothetical protein